MTGIIVLRLCLLSVLLYHIAAWTHAQGPNVGIGNRAGDATIQDEFIEEPTTGIPPPLPQIGYQLADSDLGTVSIESIRGFCR